MTPGLKELRKEFDQRIAPVTELLENAPPLDLRILQKRIVVEHEGKVEEWKIEYKLETEETMVEPGGQKASAYLLIPRREEVRPPYPGIVAFHQCAVDCVLGKESVVGKVFHRPDQAYGLELALEGFAVLAPDSVNCGERRIPAIREENKNQMCVSIIDEPLGRPHCRAPDMGELIGVAFGDLEVEPKVGSGVAGGRGVDDFAQVP